MRGFLTNQKHNECKHVHAHVLEQGLTDQTIRRFNLLSILVMLSGMSCKRTGKELLPNLRIGILLRIARRVSDFNNQRYYNPDSIHHLDREYLVDVILREYDQDERYRKIITDMLTEEGYLLLN